MKRFNSLASRFPRDDKSNLEEIAKQNTFSTKYFYDDFDRIIKVSSQAGEYSYTYDKKGRVASLTMSSPSVCSVVNSYDKAGRLLSKTFSSPQSPDPKPQTLCSYEYDKLDRRVKASVNGVEWIYTYDKYNQLTTASSSDGHIYGYSFDGIGNRLSDEKTKYAYNKLNQIVSSEISDMKSDAAGEKAGKDFIYDAYGNLTKTPDMECKYDLRNRLVEVKKADITVNYSYDPLGQRISSVEATAGGLKTTKFLMSGMVEQARVVDSVIQFHTLGLDLAQALTATGGVGAVLSSTSYTDASSLSPNASFNYLYDGNGNVISTCDASGSITAKLAYSPFGEQLDGPQLPFTFSTKAVDASGLAYYGFRFYSAQLGRWMSRDPIEELGHMNLYVACSNDVISRYDILGTISCLNKWIQIGYMRGQIAEWRMAQASLVVAIGVEGIAINSLRIIKGNVFLARIVAYTALQTCLEKQRKAAEDPCADPVDCTLQESIVESYDAEIAYINEQIELHVRVIVKLTSFIALIDGDIEALKLEIDKLEHEPCTLF